MLRVHKKITPSLEKCDKQKMTYNEFLTFERGGMIASVRMTVARTSINELVVKTAPRKAWIPPG